MKKGACCFCAGLLAVILLSAVAVPCYAVTDEYTSTGTFWSSLKEKWWLGFGHKFLIGHLADSACSESPDSRHHGSLKTYNQNSDGSYTAICNYCSVEFPVYDADLSAAYDDYVQTLPATGYDSSGSITWSPKLDVMTLVWEGSRYCYYYCPHGPANNENSLTTSCVASFNCENMSVSARPSIGNDSFSFNRFQLSFKDSYPIDGYYLRIASSLFKENSIDYDSKPFTYEYSIDAESSASLHYAGSTFSYGSGSFRTGGSGYKYFSAQCYAPVYKITPFNPSGVGDTYNINTRPTSISGGNYGIVGDNGQITKVEDNSTIINETNNTFYNPATGQTVPIVNWSYDYSDRSYKVTLESGDTATITYGDENITISQITTTEGDTITNNYTIYYLIDGTGSVTPPCEHDWQEASSTAPTCTLPGSKLLTCSKCQQTKTESIPALGHDWQVKRTVTTQYDDTGQLIQQGYTIFECSRCKEQYKSTDGAIPPGGGSGTDPGGDEEGETIWDKLGNLIGSVLGGLIGMVEAVLGKILDALTALADMLMEKLKTVVETILSIFDELPLLFGGFLDFLAALFPFLPAELMTILTFGILAVVFIGIIKAVRR